MFLVTFTETSFPITSSPCLTEPILFTSILTVEKNFSALPPEVVVCGPGVNENPPIFSLIWFIKIITVFDFEILPVSFLSAFDISLA